MKPTVSLIDDEASVLDAVGMLLSTKDYAVACYRDARSFLSAPFAAGCIVSDVRMPETTGLDLLRILQTSKDTRPLILLTGHGDVEMAVQAIKLGAYDFIEKPFSNDRLLSSVAAALVVAESSREETLHQQELCERYNSLSERQRDASSHSGAGQQGDRPTAWDQPQDGGNSSDLGDDEDVGQNPRRSGPHGDGARHHLNACSNFYVKLPRSFH